MASVTLFNTMDQKVLASGAVETPKVHLQVPIVCAYVKSMLISADFSSMGYLKFVSGQLKSCDTPSITILCQHIVNLA